jgi:hypothetical protein
VLAVLAVMAVASCAGETAEKFEALYVRSGDELELVDPGEIRFGQDAIERRVASGPDETMQFAPIEGELLRSRVAFVRGGNGDLVREQLSYELLTPANELLASVRMANIDGERGYDRIVRSGDLSRLPELEGLTGTLELLDGMTDLGIDVVKREGTRTLTDLGTGDPVEEAE